MSKQSVEITEIVTKYLEVRSKREALLKDYENIDAEFKNEQQQYEAMLLDACNKIGANSINTEQGTVVRKLNERFFCNDWDNFYKFVIEHNAPQLLEKRIHQGNFKEFYEPNVADGLPPGVNVSREFTIVVRKPSK
jgi:hypothetical protein